MKKIVKSGGEKGAEHRAMITVCPDCNYDSDESNTANDKPWMQGAVILVLQPRFYKKGHVAIVSECPKCFKKSWLHVDIDRVHWFSQCLPKKWIDAIKAEGERLKLQAVREWPKGLCWRCKHLKEATIDYHCYRQCIVGMGGPETECDDFEQVPT